MKSYKIITKLNLVIQYISGSVSISDIKEFMTDLSSDPNYSKNYDTIVDLRESIFNKNIVGEVKEYGDFVTHELSVIGKKRSSI